MGHDEEMVRNNGILSENSKNTLKKVREMTMDWLQRNVKSLPYSLQVLLNDETETQINKVLRWKGAREQYGIDCCLSDETLQTIERLSKGDGEDRLKAYHTIQGSDGIHATTIEAFATAQYCERPVLIRNTDGLTVSVFGKGFHGKGDGNFEHNDIIGLEFSGGPNTGHYNVVENGKWDA